MSVKTYPMPQFPRPAPLTEADLAWAEAFVRSIRTLEAPMTTHQSRVTSMGGET